jgi:hypothetical protein
VAITTQFETMAQHKKLANGGPGDQGGEIRLGGNLDMV